MRAIHAALGRDGPVTMLWVSSAEGDAECGSVEVLAPGLLRAHVDRLNLFEDARAASFDWFEICDKALALSSGVEPVTQRAELPDPRRAHRVLPLSALAEAVAGGAILRAAILHGDGIVTVGDAAVAETLPPDCVRGGQIELPVGRADARLDTGYYLFASDADCESDWLAVLDVRYNREAYDWFAREISPLAKPILLLPDRMDFDALSALRVLAARPVPRLPIPIGRRASVQVLYVPQRPRD